MFQQYLNEIKIVIRVVCVLLVIGGTWKITSEHYKALMEKQDKARAEEVVKAQAAQQQLTLTSETQHGKDQQLINFLRRESGSVPIHIPSTCPLPSPGSGGDERARVLSETIDRAVEELRAEDKADSADADQLNIDTIRLNGELGM